MSTQNYVAYIGIDWADRKHDIALYDCTSDTWQEYIIKTRPQDILDWVNQLRSRFVSSQNPSPALLGRRGRNSIFYINERQATDA